MTLAQWRIIDDWNAIDLCCTPYLLSNSDSRKDVLLINHTLRAKGLSKKPYIFIGWRSGHCAVCRM